MRRRQLPLRSRPLLGIVAIAVAGCSSTSEPGGPADGGAGSEGSPCLFCSDATIADDAPLALQVKGKVDQICANPDGCHGGGAPMGLTVGHEFDQMIGVTSSENPPMKRVQPFDPAQSYVFIKLACDGGIVDGGCMPLSTGFDPKLAQLFHDWIEAGAPTQ
jgi:hypothetical protein